MKKWLGMLLASVVAVSFVLTGCTNKNTDNSVIQIGTNAEFPPFEKLEGDGKITGFDADLIQAIAKEENLKINFKHYGWDQMLDGVSRGKLDAGMAAITITPDRKKKYDFSIPYFDAKQLILVPTSSHVSSLKQLNGKRIGVQTATTGEQVVQEMFGKTYSGLKGYDDIPSAVHDLELGRLDAVVVDNAVIMEYIKKLGQGKYKIVEDPSIKTEQYGIAVHKGNQALLQKLNDGLKKVKANGTYDKIYQKYFGTEPQQ
ncbi:MULTISPECIES: basic amino acid ABC transporter substrate-binding protein [Thermoactinomyces]|uniref:Basic amino acid ABC transporter substrate-binding protein n=1 Tax=Thermoactinomyces daqus TaxID=1329516 RepID=A0A7W2AHK0_9BACL|nr:MULTISPECIES: basic amino acid ABC transporter substrate-binding protein [Thermoactinomyces]MBA4541784.1 basic amino acid ABC transporter substrate-binding protein [Thermoactinomyces daqus]MBH8608654.1 basic amino acid ABC transporter substrate-binding protein [Thermoactinomyces sp. CICC 10521]